MSLFASQIAEKFQKEYCSDTTSGQHFWIWEPIDDPTQPYQDVDLPLKKYCQLLFSPSVRQRRESLEVLTELDNEKTLIAIDSCLILHKEPVRRCDAMLIHQNDRSLVWIELKLNLKTKNAKLATLLTTLFGEEPDASFGGAFEQIMGAKRHFETKGVDVQSKKNLGFVAIPEKLMTNTRKSQELQKQRAKFRLQNNFNVEVGCVLDLSSK